MRIAMIGDDVYFAEGREVKRRGLVIDDVVATFDDLAEPPAAGVDNLATDGVDLFASAGNGGQRGKARIVRIAPSGGDEPVALVTSRMGVSALAVDATHVYWVEANFQASDVPLQRVPKGGGPIEILVRDPGAFDLALAGDRVFFAGNDGVFSVPAARGAVTPVLDEQLRGAQELVADEKGLLVAASGGIFRVPKGSRTATRVFGTANVEGLASEGGEVFWSTRSPVTIAGTLQPTGLFRIRESGDEAAQVSACNLRSCVGVVATDSSILWHDDGVLRVADR